MGKLHSGDDLYKANWHPRCILAGKGLGLVIREVGHRAHHTTTTNHSQAMDIQMRTGPRPLHGHPRQPTQGATVGGDHQATIDGGRIVDGG